MSSRRDITRRLALLEAITGTPARERTGNLISLWRKLLTEPGPRWSAADVHRIAVETLRFCEKYPTPEHDIIHRLIVDVLPLVDMNAGPEQTPAGDLEEFEGMKSNGHAPPHLTAAVVMGAAGIADPFDTNQ